MRRWPSFAAGIVFGLVAVLGLPAPAAAQITWNVTYLDGAGVGFNDPTVPPGETLSLGTLRRNSVTASFNYLNTVLDGRGTVNVRFLASDNNSGSGALASFGPYYFTGLNGSFQNGLVYQNARANQALNSADGQGQVNFGHAYNYAGQQVAPSGSAYDLTSILTHEFTHGTGFINFVNQNGQGINGQTVGSPDGYSVYDSNLQRGNGAGATPLFNKDITNANFASFANSGNASTFTNGNNATTGLFFGGKYAKEIYGSPVPLYAPTTFAPGSSIGHDNTTSPVGLMNYSIGQNTVRPFQPYEIGMMMDLGWNVYNWDGNTSGNFLDGQSDVANSHWRTDLGIVYDGSSTYNIKNTPGQAPILPPYAQVTSNIVLNFGGSGSSSYTSTNDIGTVRLARLNLNSTSTATNTITGGTLLFGRNSDGSASVLAPKIVQQNSGPFVIASTIQIPNGLTVDGAGSGRVTLSGPISGAGGLTKAGNFTLALTGNNTYSGGTSVTAGTVLVNGQTGSNSGTGSGTVTVSGGTLGGNGRIGGSLNATGGGVMPGDTSTTGILTVGTGVTFTSAATLTARLNGATAGTGYDQLRVESGDVALGNAALTLMIGYSPALSDQLVIVRNDGTGATTGQFAGFAPGSPVTIGSTTVYAYYNYDIASGLFGSGNDVAITFAPVPEPALVLLVAAVALGLIELIRRRKRLRGSS